MANDETPTAGPDKDPLEVLLEREITLDSRIDEFLVLSGLMYDTHPAYYASKRPELQAAARGRYEQRHAEPSSPIGDRRIWVALIENYDTHRQTLRDVKAHFKTVRGFRDFGLDHSRAKRRFDEILLGYGIAPFPFQTRAEDVAARRAWRAALRQGDKRSYEDYSSSMRQDEQGGSKP